MQTLFTSCHTMDCRPVMTGLGSYYVTTAKLDSAGKATLSAQVQIGPYFLFALVRNPDGSSLLWDIPTRFTPATTPSPLTAAIAEVVH
jgi:hypothetical protein